jgi:hypothetical protein
MRERPYDRTASIQSRNVTRKAAVGKIQSVAQSSQGTPLGVERDRLLQKAKQLESTVQISEWLRSTGPQVPK